MRSCEYYGTQATAIQNYRCLVYAQYVDKECIGLNRSGTTKITVIKNEMTIN